MLELLAIVLIVLWLVGVLAVHIGGMFIHLLLVVALVIIVFRLIRGERIL